MTREVVWDHGVALPGHRLWLDPLTVRSFAFISHAHTDHARRHKEALLTPQLISRLTGAAVSQSDSIHRRDPYCSFVVERPTDS